MAFNQVIETIAAADASTAWCLAQAVASTNATGYLDPKIAREVFGPPDGAVAWGPPSGAKAVAAEGGYFVTGRWRFASGSTHCPWMGGHSMVFEADGKISGTSSMSVLVKTGCAPETTVAAFAGPGRFRQFYNMYSRNFHSCHLYLSRVATFLKGGNFSSRGEAANLAS